MPKIKGTVISNKMQNTIVVVVDFTMRHPKYGKIIRKTTKIHAHNNLNDIKIGDMVNLVQSKPYSKTVHFKTVEIVPALGQSKKTKAETKPPVNMTVQKEEKKKPSIKVKNEHKRKSPAKA